MLGLRHIAITITAWACLSGCSASYNRQDTGGADLSGTRLDAAKPVLIAVPADGSYQGKPYPGSGQTVAQQTAAAFAKYARKVDTAPATVTERSALLDAARTGGFGYVVMPVIAHWEQRATEWSGLPSRASIGVSVIDAQTGEKVQSSSLDARSRIMSLTPTNPESLLSGLLGNYVTSLYGAKQ